jgi:hypothetical protein
MASARADKGDITTSASGATWTIDNNVVSYAKLQDASAGNVVLARAAGTSGDYGEVAVGASQLFGRGSTGDVAPITLGTALSMSGTTLNAAGVSDGDKGDITVSASGATWTIDNEAVSYAKIQNVAANTFLANATGSPATVQEIATSRIPLFASAITGTPSGSTYLRGDGTWATVSGSGDVVGPASATDHAIARFDFTTGKLLQNSNAILTDAGTLTLDAGSTTNALVVTTTGAIQQSLRYDGSNRLDTAVSSVGTVTVTPVGTDPRLGLASLTGINASPSATAAVQVGRTVATTGVSQRGVAIEWGANSAATSSALGFFIAMNSSGLSGTWTTTLLSSLYVSNPIKAAGQTVTTNYGLFVDNQTAGATNYAIYTGTGRVRLGDRANIDFTSNGNYALDVTATSTASTNNGLAIRGAAQGNHVSGFLPLLYGVEGTVAVQGSGGTTTKAVGVRAFVFRSAGTLDEGIGVEVGDMTSAMNSAYGLKVGNVTGGATNYAIYTGTGLVRFGDTVNTTSVYQVNGTQVVGAQGATITDPTGGTVQDSEARTAINTLIDRLQAHGLIA